MKIALAVGAAVFTTLLGAPLTHATPLDPHIPSIAQGNCPGVRGGFGMFYCDGEHYPDGTYWHQIVDYNSAASGSMTCVVDNGSILPPLAPPGGCGGAA